MFTSKAHIRQQRILDFEDARQLVLEHAEQERVIERKHRATPLLDSLGRVLAEDIYADRDLPPFARATRDGYAEHSDDLKDTATVLKVAGQIRAGGELPP